MNLILFVMVFIFLIGFSSAAFSIGNLSHKILKTSYGPEEIIKGWIKRKLIRRRKRVL